MNSDLEKQILKLKPGALPPDLKERLRDEPPADQPLECLPELKPDSIRLLARKKRWGWSAFAGAAVAACVAFMLVRHDFISAPEDDANRQASAGLRQSDYHSIIRKNQTLLSTKTLATEEIGGQVWEIAEEKWMDNTVATCSTSPVLVSAKEIRREIVFRPVVFQ